jgi:hypothetical protein
VTQKHRTADLIKELSSLQSRNENLKAWRKCQDLAQIALRTSGQSKRKVILRQAFESALEAGEPNRIVTVSAWPLKVLCLHGEPKELEVEIDRLLSIISREPSPVRRLDALNYMLGAIVSGPKGLFMKVFAQFRNACLEPLEGLRRNRRGESALATFIPILAHIDRKLASELIEQIKGPSLRERARQNIEEYRNLEVDQICVWPNIG